MTKRMTKNIIPFLRYFKWQVILVVTAFISLIVISLSMRYASNQYVTMCATGKDSYPGLYEDYFGDKGYITEDLETIFNTQKYEKMTDAIQVGMDSENLIFCGITVPSSLTVAMDKVNKTAITIGFILALATFMASLFNTMMRSGQGVDALIIFRQFIIYIIAIFLVTNGSKICYTITGIGGQLAKIVTDGNSIDATTSKMKDVQNALRTGIAETVDATVDIVDMDEEFKVRLEKEYKEIDDKYNDTTVISVIGKSVEKAFVKAGNGISKSFANMGQKWTYHKALLKFHVDLQIVKFASFVCSIAVQVAMWSRGLEIVILATISPIAFGLMGDGNFRWSSTERFIKYMAALSLQGMIILLIMYTCSAVSFGVINQSIMTDIENVSSFSAFSGLIIVNFAEYGMVKKSSEIAQKLF